MKRERTVSIALVLVVLMSGFAGCFGAKVSPLPGAAELSTELYWADFSTEYSLPVMTSEPTERSERSAPAADASTRSAASGKKPTAAAPEASTVSPQKAKTGAVFFDDAVFVGDSVTLALKNTATSQRNAGNNYLGKAKFLASGSLSYTNSSWELNNPRSVHPKIKGKKVTLEDGVKQLGARKVFIMLGMNDFAAYDNNKVIETAVRQVNKIIQKSPGVQIYIQSVTPITADKQHGKFNNKNVDAFNEKLKAMCASHGWTYVDINSQFKDGSGNLTAAYCGDPQGMGIHMSKKGCDKWVSYLTSTFAS